jgi:hypothetical protein
MATKRREPAEVQKAVENILNAIINEWYERVSGYYVTHEYLLENPESGREEELKRFHDERGHRIKFNKDDLDFTYGLRSNWQGEHIVIEVSVNNKVKNFDYNGFRDRLLSHYMKTGSEKVPTPWDLRSFAYGEVFKFEPNLQEAFSVERRDDKADIMRLAFHVYDHLLDRLVAHPLAGKQLVESYCVSPFRTVYAAVYRRSSR